MTFEQTILDGVYIITPQKFEDNRGYFMETFNQEIPFDILQTNQSYTKGKYTVRGIHFQEYPKWQSKLVRVIEGEVLDVVVDLRKDSPTYKQYIAERLSPTNKKMILIPPGFGHGFKTLTDNVLFEYQVGESVYDQESENGIRYDDPELGIKWGIVDVSALSEKDLNARYLREMKIDFPMWEKMEDNHYYKKMNGFGTTEKVN